MKPGQQRDFFFGYEYWNRITPIFGKISAVISDQYCLVYRTREMRIFGLKFK
jgi:hypothetical protein